MTSVASFVGAFKPQQGMPTGTAAKTGGAVPSKQSSTDTSKSADTTTAVTNPDGSVTTTVTSGTGAIVSVSTAGGTGQGLQASNATGTGSLLSIFA